MNLITTNDTSTRYISVLQNELSYLKEFVEVLWLTYSTDFRNAIFNYFNIVDVKKYWIIWSKTSTDAVLEKMRLSKEEEILKIYEPFKPKQ